jgi:transcriptional regulator with XRE-family HTH domain
VSGIESGRISRPHFGTLKKLAGALEVDPRELLELPRGLGGAAGGAEAPLPVPFSLVWAMSSREEEFEEGLEGATLGDLLALSRELDEEQERLRRLYGEAGGVEQRRIVRGRIRAVAALRGSLRVVVEHHPALQRT